MNTVDKNPAGMASEKDSLSPGLRDANLSGFLHELRGLAHDHIELAMLETRLSINALLKMAIFSIATALILVSAWLALIGSAALGLIWSGLEPALAMLIVAASNLILALLGWMYVKRLDHWLGWPATLRAISPAPSANETRGTE